MEVLPVLVELPEVTNDLAPLRDEPLLTEVTAHAWEIVVVLQVGVM